MNEGGKERKEKMIRWRETKHSGIKENIGRGGEKKEKGETGKRELLNIKRKEREQNYEKEAKENANT